MLRKDSWVNLLNIDIGQFNPEEDRNNKKQSKYDNRKSVFWRNGSRF